MCWTIRKGKTKLTDTIPACPNRTRATVARHRISACNWLSAVHTCSQNTYQVPPRIMLILYKGKEQTDFPLTHVHKQRGGNVTKGKLRSHFCCLSSIEKYSGRLERLKRQPENWLMWCHDCTHVYFDISNRQPLRKWSWTQTRSLSFSNVRFKSIIMHVFCFVFFCHSQSFIRTIYVLCTRLPMILDTYVSNKCPHSWSILGGHRPDIAQLSPEPRYHKGKLQHQM